MQRLFVALCCFTFKERATYSNRRRPVWHVAGPGTPARSPRLAAGGRLRRTRRPAPARSLHEEDRLSLLWSLERIAPLRGAVRARRAAAVDRAGRGGGGARRGWRILPRASLCPAARVALPTARGGRGEDEPHRD